MKKFICSLAVLFSFFNIAHSAAPLNQDVVELLMPKLNSDRIEYFFGSFGVDVFENIPTPFTESRVSNLYSVHNNQKVCRTFAVVDFQQPMHDNLKLVHKEIKDGTAIGIALRKNGWKIEKRPVYFGSVSLSPQVQALMHEYTEDQAAVHIYKLVVSKEGVEGIHYCTIIEVQNPQYLDASWLRSLYPHQYDEYQMITEEVKALMDSLQVLIRNFPTESSGAP